MTTPAIPISEWLEELDRIAKDKYGFKFAYSEQTGEDAWQDYYNSGYTPAEALAEDLSYE